MQRSLLIGCALTILFVICGQPALDQARARRGGSDTSAVYAQDAKRTIWDGVFTEAQATRGQNAYKQSCAPCHKADLLGDSGAPALAGPEFFSRWNGSNADDLVKTIRASMPQDAPDTLGTQTYVDLVTFLIKSNGGPAGSAELPIESASLKQVTVSTPK